MIKNIDLHEKSSIPFISYVGSYSRKSSFLFRFCRKKKSLSSYNFSNLIEDNTNNAKIAVAKLGTIK